MSRPASRSAHCPPPTARRSARAALFFDRAPGPMSRLALGVIVAIACAPAFAQAAPAGKGFWDTLINLLYGWPGLLIGLLFFLAAVYLWVKEGALPAVMTGLAGVILFFSPAVAQYIQQQGSASTQNITPVKQ